MNGHEYSDYTALTVTRGRGRSFSLPLSCILEGSLDGVGVSPKGGETVGAGWPKLSTATGSERVFPLDDGSLGRTASGVAVGLVDEFEA